MFSLISAISGVALLVPLLVMILIQLRKASPAAPVSTPGCAPSTDETRAPEVVPDGSEPR